MSIRDKEKNANANPEQKNMTNKRMRKNKKYRTTADKDSVKVNKPEKTFKLKIILFSGQNLQNLKFQGPHTDADTGISEN